jgi:hypothetical protein
MHFMEFNFTDKIRYFTDSIFRNGDSPVVLKHKSITKVR